MSEEEIIKNLNSILEQWQKIVNIEDPIERDIEMNCYIEEMPFYEIKGLLDLYTKEKEKNKELNLENQALYESINLNDDTTLAKMYQKEKEKNKEKSKKIKELNSLLGEFIDNSISKDKIRNKIKELQKQIIEGNIEEEHLWCLEAEIDILKELLGE